LKQGNFIEIENKEEKVIEGIPLRLSERSDLEEKEYNAIIIYFDD